MNGTNPSCGFSSVTLTLGTLTPSPEARFRENGDARGVPRVVFDEWEGMAQECRLICDRSAGDGQGIKGAPNIPLKLKLAGALVWMRSRATVKFVAYFACCMDDNTLWRFMKKWARFMIWKHFGDLVSPHHRARTWNPS